MRASSVLVLALAVGCAAVAWWVAVPVERVEGVLVPARGELVVARGAAFDGRVGVVEAGATETSANVAAATVDGKGGQPGREAVAGEDFWDRVGRDERGPARGELGVFGDGFERLVFRGRVLDAATGRPAAECAIQLEVGETAVAATTGTDGRFALELGALLEARFADRSWHTAEPTEARRDRRRRGLSQGQVEQLLLEYELADLARQAPTLVVGGPLHVDFREANSDLAAWLEAGERRFELVPSGQIHGRVVTRGAVAADVTTVVELLHKTGPSAGYWQSAWSACDAEGGFVFGDLPPGEFALVARAGRPVALEPLEPWQKGGRGVGATADGGLVAREVHLASDGGSGLASLALDANLVGRFEASLEVRPAERADVELELRAGARLTGRVLPVDGSGAVVLLEARRATVTLTPVQVGMPAELALRERRSLELQLGDGFAFDGLGTGTWRLEVTPEWGGRHALQLDVEASGAELERDLSVELPARLEGVVFAPDGQRAKFANVYLRATGDATEQRRSTDAEGEFVFDAVPTGKPLALVASIFGEGEASRTLPAMASAEQDASLVIRLEPLLTVRGVVEERQHTGRNGDRLPGAVLVAEQRDGKLRFPALKVATDANGSFLLQNLRPVETTFKLQRAGYVEAAWSADLSGTAPYLNDQPLDGPVTLTLAPALTVQGVVRDEFGGALGDVFLLAEVDERHRELVPFETRLTRSDALGRFTFPGLPDADWHVAPQDPAWLVVNSTPRIVDRSLSAGELELVLRRRSERTKASLAFDVVRAVDGLAPSGVRVVGARDAAVHVDGGEVHITGLEPSVTGLLVLADGCAAQALEATLVPGEESVLGTLALAVGTDVRVVVEGAPSAALVVELVPLPAAKGGPVTKTPKVVLQATASDHRLNGLASGRWRLRVLDGNGEVASEVVELLGGLFEHTVTVE